jgi:hypothetical protein
MEPNYAASSFPAYALSAFCQKMLIKSIATKLRRTVFSCLRTFRVSLKVVLKSIAIKLRSTVYSYLCTFRVLLKMVLKSIATKLRRTVYSYSCTFRVSPKMVLKAILQPNYAAPSSPAHALSAYRQKS